MKKALIIFIKNPEAGNIKTRLAKTIGSEKALDIYKTLLHYTNEVSKIVNADRYVFYSSFVNIDDDWDNVLFKKQLQSGNDLGVKMQHAFKQVFKYGYDGICIIGSDCPLVTADIIHQSFVELNNADVVIGPAKDGGYYLLCLKKMHAEIFKNISWSTQFVLNETIEACRRLQLTYFLLPELFDIDTEKDWNEYYASLSLINKIL